MKLTFPATRGNIDASPQRHGRRSAMEVACLTDKLFISADRQKRRNDRRTRKMWYEDGKSW
jgi:hypothetical protein